MNVLAIAMDGEGEEALRATTAYRDWCGRFDPANIMTADENLALVYKDAGRHEEAIPIMRQVRAAKLRRLRGSEDEHSVTSLLNLSASLAQADRHTEAITLLSKERPAACRALGEDHHLCLSLARILGSAHLMRGADLGDFLAAGAILRDVILRLRKVLGPDHPHTQSSEHSFVEALAALEETGCEAGILEKLCNGVLRGGWHSKEYEPRSRPDPWKK